MCKKISYRKRTVTIVLAVLGACMFAFLFDQLWRFVRLARLARQLSEECSRASEARHLAGGGGGDYITVHTSSGVHNEIGFSFRDNAHVDDEKVKHLSGLTGVIGLDLSQTKITDAGLAFINDMPDLQWLQLSRTDITDGGIEHLISLKKLEALDITGTRVTQKAAESLARIPALRIVFASQSLGLSEVPGVAVDRSTIPDTWVHSDEWRLGKKRHQ
jgi:hypothetical protein